MGPGEFFGFFLFVIEWERGGVEKHGRDGIRFGAQVHERKSTSANLINYLGTPLPAASSPESSRANP